MIIDGSHASSSEDEFEKELNLLEQRKSPDQAISSTLYANAQFKQKVTSSIEKVKRLGRLKADSVWKIIDTLDEPLLTTAKILSAMPVTQVSVERFYWLRFALTLAFSLIGAGLFAKTQDKITYALSWSTRKSLMLLIIIGYFNFFSLIPDRIASFCAILNRKKTQHFCLKIC